MEGWVAGAGLLAGWLARHPELWSVELFAVEIWIPEKNTWRRLSKPYVFVYFAKEPGIGVLFF